MEQQKTNIFDVLGGNESIKGEFSLNVKNIAMVGLVLAIIFLLAAYIFKQIK